MNPGTMLTGYGESTLRVLHQPNPETDISSLWDGLFDTYFDLSGCAEEGLEGAKTIPNNLHKDEPLHLSCLFGELPWLTASLAECFKFPTGLAKVLLLLLFCRYIQKGLIVI
jgi:hypothetical protein